MKEITLVILKVNSFASLVKSKIRCSINAWDINKFAKSVFQENFTFILAECLECT